MRERRHISVALAAALGLAAAWNVWMIYPPEAEPVDPVVRLALDIGHGNSLGSALTMPQACGSLASLYARASLMADNSIEVGGHLMALRSKEELGIEYLDAHCPAGMLLVMDSILRDNARGHMEALAGRHPAIAP